MLPSTYAKLSTEVLTNITQANAAALDVFTPASKNGSEQAATATTDVEPDTDHAGWESTVSADDDLEVGDKITFSKAIHERDVERFAAASGDTNPLHLDDEFAKETRFEGRIAHGILVSGLISAAIARFPGEVVYLSQDLEFLSPVEIGDSVTADVELVEDLGNDQYRMTTTVTKDDEVVVDGEAVVLIVTQ